MAERPPSHRNEQTGNPALDRIQNNVRELVQFAKQLVARVVRIELGRGTQDLAKVEMPDADMTLSAEHFAAGYWIFVGTLTAPRTVRVPRATDAAVWSRWVYNFTGGGQNIVIATDDGSQSVGNATGMHLIATGSYGVESWL